MILVKKLYWFCYGLLNETISDNWSDFASFFKGSNFNGKCSIWYVPSDMMHYTYCYELW